MKIRRWMFAATALALVVATSACGGGSDGESDTGGQTDAGSTDTGGGVMDVTESDTGSMDTGGGARADITGLQITPDTISSMDTGMTDQYLDVTIEVTGFDGTISAVELFIVENDRKAPSNPARTMNVQGDTIQIENVQVTWFQGMNPGTYAIGATVEDDAGTSVTVRDLADVTLEE